MANNTTEINFKNNKLHPLSINILKRQRYDFSKFNNDEILFFEYLILYSSFVEFKEFYRCDKKILEDTNLKRTVLNKAKEKFVAMGFLKIEIKGLPVVTHYNINYNILLNKLNEIYKTEFIEDIKGNFIDFQKKKNPKPIIKNSNAEVIPIYRRKIS